VSVGTNRSAYSQTMRTRPASLTFLHARLPDAVVTTGGRGLRFGAVLRLGGGGKFGLAETCSISVCFRHIHDGMSGFVGMRLKLGSAAGLSTTMVPSDVREHAPSGSSKLPATTIMPTLRVPIIGLEESRFANVPWARTSWRFWGRNRESHLLRAYRRYHRPRAPELPK